jgi:hypothetical protein
MCNDGMPRHLGLAPSRKEKILIGYKIQNHLNRHLMPHMRKLPFVATLAALFASALCAQIPETPAGRQFSAWLAAFNSGDRAVMQQYFDKSMTFGRIDQDMAIRARTGGFDVKKVEESADTRIVVLCQERGPGQQFTRIMMSVAPTEPHNVAGSGAAAG